MQPAASAAKSIGVMQQAGLAMHILTFKYLHAT